MPDDHPTLDAETHTRRDPAEPADDPGPDHESDEAELLERDTGAHEEQISQEGNLRAPEDESPPGS